MRRLDGGATPLGDAPVLQGRARECTALEDLLDKVCGGEGTVLVLRGEAGIGKTALMGYCAGRAGGCQLVHVVAVESEREMPFAALHQLCRPLLADLDALPEPQQHALRVAFGLAAGSAPDRFVIGLAVLGLLAEATAKRPLLCLVDDTQWLDEPSRQVFGFVGRRLSAAAVLLLLAVREAGEQRLFPALSSLTLTGLAQEDARALLQSAVSGPLDARVRDRIVMETRGNPLRLLKLPRQMCPGELAGGFGMPRPGISSGPVEERYARQIRALPEPTQHLLLLASADPTGDATLLWRAATSLGIPRGAAAAAELEELLEIGGDVRFRLPVVRSAAYTVATAEDRRAAHAALAEATDASVDPERRLWHLAEAASGPDEAVASQLEQTAASVRAHAGLVAEAAFLQRSLELTADPEQSARRALAAAQAQLHAGAFEAALGRLAEARAVAIDDLQRGQIERLEGQAQHALNAGPEAPVVLLKAAKKLEPLDAGLARETYLDAWMASLSAGVRGWPGSLLPEVSRAARSAPPAPDGVRPCDLLLDGLAVVVTDGRPAAAASLRRALDAFLSDGFSDREFLQRGHLAATAACALWDWRAWEILAGKLVELARASGALAPLSLALHSRSVFAAWCGDLKEATEVAAEFKALNDATGIERFPVGWLLAAAYQGQLEALTRMEISAADSFERGVGQDAQYARWTKAVLCNGLGRYKDALAAAHSAAYDMEIPDVTGWALPELIEAAVRSGRPQIASEALEHLSRHTIDEADWAAGVEARCRALVNEEGAAEARYSEALDRLGLTPFRTELARTRLLYGEWLRRQRRPVDARAQLAPAYDMFVAMGADGFSERARRELAATGTEVRKRNADATSRDELTSQEASIARLARDGRTNAEIGADLYLSVRTVEWHLRKVFMKLGVSSRKDLKEALRARGRHEAT